MYRKNAKGWLKHWDFLLLDIFCLEISFIIVRYLLINRLFRFFEYQYTIEALLLLVSDVVVVFFTEPYKNILRRGPGTEFGKVLRHIVTVYILNLVLLYFMHQAEPYSRLLMFLSAVLSIGLCFAGRVVLKKWIRYQVTNKKPDRSIIVITTSCRMKYAIDNVINKTYHSYWIPAIFLVDREKKEKEVYNDIQVYGKEDDLVDYIVHRWCDEVYVDLDEGVSLPKKKEDELLGMGITVHSALHAEGSEHTVEKFGADMVITSSVRIISLRTMIVKRLLDIAGGLIGCAITGVLYLILAPQIYHASPGPIFFKQTRIGQNGKKFTMYKFRSMYLDAEQRKSEYLEANKADSDLIFKMDDDPRIIGSEKKDRKGRPNGIGNKMRRKSLDEFPQFWNVLKGDMSLVGTRPPTVDEWDKYSAAQRLRMSIKPGITGLWQISGRSEITDFDEIVRLDTEYIRTMSIKKDFIILLKTVGVVVKGSGAE